ncbi:flagellar hook-length control protein FliK [Caulobacter vibrioides]|uniref:flagellar hook-length control protein FliK n=1 Tax=Caulobacter vibrioides TaxID=155892 RepID=UPI001E4FAC96|nr:flagellar hook-length control protein FliK [Caulobacter vibrioides]
MTNATAQLAGIVGQAEAGSPQARGQVEQAGQSSAGDAERAATTPKEALSPTVQATAPVSRSPPETQIARAVRVATAEAVPRQAGIAPLMADIAAIVGEASSPPDVVEAARTLLSVTPTIPEITTAAGLRQAVERSGVLLEAHLARAAAVPSAAGPAPQPIASQGDLKAALLVFRGALSAWLARIELPARPSEQRRDMAPQPVGDAAPDLADPAVGRPLGDNDKARAVLPVPAAPMQRSPTPGPPVAHPLAQAAGASAPQAAAPLAQAFPAGPPPQASPPIIEAPIDSDIEARFGAFVAPPPKGGEPSTAKAPLAKPTPPALIQVEHLDGDVEPPETQPTDPIEARPLVARGYGASGEEVRAKTPPPPYAGGPTAGQKPMDPSPQLTGSPEAMARRLLKSVQSALARQDLMQIASLPEPVVHEQEISEPRIPSAKLNFDLPFVTPQGVAVAQFEISRDGGGGGGGAVSTIEPTYRARFSIDVEPLGPVHALVVLTGARTRVSLWAERAETISRLRAGEEALGAALRQADLTPEVAVHSGAPPVRGVSALGHFVDQAS